ncbi:nucleoside monophosphate kinase [Patescibacteria group bacterium]|nr:nucleoside monophosphate kinase [Patescibacteria group bacterium]
MKDLDFPLFKTRIENSPKFDLTDVEQRMAYFELKAGPEIQKLKEYLKDGSFIAYFLGKKNSGKGTYAKMFTEIFGKDKIAHLSVGDMVRGVDKELEDPEKKAELIDFLKKNYRGFIPLEEIIESLESRSTTKLLPSELILALAKREISRLGKKSIFLDGFPRDLDQVSYSLFFRDLVNYREDPDVMILIDIPETVIDARIKQRVICPLCNTSRSLTLFPTKKVEYENGKFHLVCDNPDCEGARMVPKEGDEHGIEPIRERLTIDEGLLKKAFSLYGIPKVLLRNDIPVDKAGELVNDYELTPEFSHVWTSHVQTSEKPWSVNDDNGTPSYSLMPSPVVVSMIKQLVEVLNL